MRSSTPIVFLALSSLAAPTLAAPTFASQPVYAREEAASALLARQAQNADQSGAFLPLLLSAGSALLSLFHGKREFEDLMAREPMIFNQNSGIQCALYKTNCRQPYRTPTRPNGVPYMIARDVQPGDEQSGAFLPLLLSAIPAAISLFKGKREFEDLMAREAHTVAEFKAGLEEYLRTHGGHLRRAEPGEESGAILPLLLSAIPAVISLFKGKREFDDLFARELEQELLARADTPESGAFLPLLLSAIPAAISLFKGKREFEEVFARSLVDLD